MTSTAVRAVLLGAASGGRAASGLAAVSLSGADDPNGGRFSSPWSRRIAAGSALGEAVVDKLPNTPSRLVPAQLGGRVAAAALATTLLLKREGASNGALVLPVLLAVAAAVGTSYLGSRWRAYSADQGYPLPGALAEDAATVALAAAAVR